MIVSSRTPEGHPNRCVVCGKRIHIEPSEPTGDAPCPKCGQLNWWDETYSVSTMEPLEFSIQSFDLLMSRPVFDRWLEGPRSDNEVPVSEVNPGEAAPALEKEGALSIPNEDVADIHSLEELVAYFERMSGNP